MDRSDSSYVSQSSTPVQNDRMCDFCGVVKKSPSDLARHLLKHTGEHPFKCDVSFLHLFDAHKKTSDLIIVPNAEHIISSPGHRPCELLPSLCVRRRRRCRP